MRRQTFESIVRKALGFDSADADCTPVYQDAEWGELLSFCDRETVTLAYGQRMRDQGPEWVRARLDRNLRDSSARFDKIKNSYCEIARALDSEGAEHIVLKGFSQTPDYPRDPRLRMQSDIDLYCPPDSVPNAVRALRSIGYVPARWSEHSPSPLHVPAMVRGNGYVWKGNCFDPEAPIPIDVHTRLWNSEAYLCGPDELAGFWDRRIIATIDDVSFPALHPADAIGFAALHALRHALLDSLHLGHIYEIAWFLHVTSRDESMWPSWQEWHEPSLRLLEGVIFRIAQSWFRCDVSTQVEDEIRRLPSHIRWWLGRYAESSGSDWSAKEALWLQVGLAAPQRRWEVLRAGLFGGRTKSKEAFVSEITGAEPRLADHLYARLRHSAYLGERALYHGYKLPGTLWNGVGWWLSRNGNEPA